MDGIGGNWHRICRDNICYCFLQCFITVPMIYRKWEHSSKTINSPKHKNDEIDGSSTTTATGIVQHTMQNLLETLRSSLPCSSILKPISSIAHDVYSLFRAQEEASPSNLV